MCVCVYVCVRACVRACVCVHACVCMCACVCNFHISDQREFLWFKCVVSQLNLVQLPIGMHIIMLQLPLVRCNDTRKPIQTSCITTIYIDTPNLRTIDYGFKLLGVLINFYSWIKLNLITKCSNGGYMKVYLQRGDCVKWVSTAHQWLEYFVAWI